MLNQETTCDRFLLPRLHLDRLCNQTRISKVRKALEDLPSKLDETYEDAMNRIKHQCDEHYQLALRVLSWISKAQRPLRIEELQHAVAVEAGDDDIDEDPLESPALFVSVCAGLVTIDEESGSFRLVHFTVEEFFKHRHYEWFPDAQKLIAETCLTYLSFVDFGQGTDKYSYEFRALLQKYPLLQYAVDEWAIHVRRAAFVLEEVRNLALKFLGNDMKVASAVQIYDGAQRLNRKYVYFRKRYCVARVPGSHLLTMLRCEQLAACWQAWGGDINAKDHEGQSALHLAVFAKDFEMTRCLLNAGADMDIRDAEGWTALISAAYRWWDEGVQLLLEEELIRKPNATGIRRLFTFFASIREGEYYHVFVLLSIYC